MKQLINYMEIVADEYLKENLSETGVCQCEECRMDIMAIMLNKLKPHYIVSESGALFAQLKQYESQRMTDLVIAMTEAAEIVKMNSRHNK